jgi:hypothetical protein
VRRHQKTTNSPQIVTFVPASRPTWVRKHINAKHNGSATALIREIIVITQKAQPSAEMMTQLGAEFVCILSAVHPARVETLPCDADWPIEPECGSYWRHFTRCRHKEEVMAPQDHAEQTILALGFNAQGQES